MDEGDGLWSKKRASHMCIYMSCVAIVMRERDETESYDKHIEQS